MKIVAILQARCGSTRLPNKVLKPILGKPMLQWQLERILKCTAIDQLLVATSLEDSDKPLIALCESIDIDVFAGNLNNVLDRFYQAALTSKADIIVRLTGDCPLTDPQVIDSVIKAHIAEGNDYTSNVEPETFPDGLDVEVMTFNTLSDAWLKAESNSDKEHVTPYIRKNKEYKKGSVLSDVDYSKYRWTVDEPRDFEFVSKVYSLLANEGAFFGTQDIYKLLDSHPELLEINTNIQRNEGYLKSLKQDNLVED